MPNPVRVELWQAPGGAWRARIDAETSREVSGPTRRACLERVEEALGGIGAIVEERPQLVGVAEAAAILGWDRRRVITYIDRGRFPEPLARLAGGRVWRRADIESFAAGWRLRRAARGS